MASSEGKEEDIELGEGVGVGSLHGSDGVGILSLCGPKSSGPDPPYSTQSILWNGQNIFVENLLSVRP